MEAQQIVKIVSEELKERNSFEWPESWAERIEELIVDPFSGNFFNPETQQYEDFWIVANLDPENMMTGYLVIYDVDTDLFGLATKGDLFEDGSGLVVGLYGTFAKTLENVDV